MADFSARDPRQPAHSTGRKPTRKPAWKPPIWFLVLEAFGIVALGLGLLMHFSPDSAIAQSLPPEARLPLLVFGGAAFALSWLAIVLSILSVRRG